MFNPNQIVEYEGRYGRVVYHDPLTHFVHVLLKTNTNTWKVEKCDVFFCKPAQVYLWSIENAFCLKYQRKPRTPNLVPLDINDDCVMEI